MKEILPFVQDWKVIEKQSQDVASSGNKGLDNEIK